MKKEKITKYTNKSNHDYTTFFHKNGKEKVNATERFLNNNSSTLTSA